MLEAGSAASYQDSDNLKFSTLDRDHCSSSSHCVLVIMGCPGRPCQRVAGRGPGPGMEPADPPQWSFLKEYSWWPPSSSTRRDRRLHSLKLGIQPYTFTHSHSAEPIHFLRNLPLHSLDFSKHPRQVPKFCHRMVKTCHVLRLDRDRNYR